MILCISLISFTDILLLNLLMAMSSSSYEISSLPLAAILLIRVPRFVPDFPIASLVISLSLKIVSLSLVLIALILSPTYFLFSFKILDSSP